MIVRQSRPGAIYPVLERIQEGGGLPSVDGSFGIVRYVTARVFDDFSEQVLHYHASARRIDGAIVAVASGSRPHQMEFRLVRT